jgi:hypothetical protein
VDQIAQLLCSEGTASEVAEVRDYLQARVRSHPSEAPDFEAVTFRLSSDCRAARAAGKPQGPPQGGVLFGN